MTNKSISKNSQSLRMTGQSRKKKSQTLGMPNKKLVLDHAADRFSLMHQVECFVHLLQRHGVGYQVVDVDLASHIGSAWPFLLAATASAPRVCELWERCVICLVA